MQVQVPTPPWYWQAPTTSVPKQMTPLDDDTTSGNKELVAAVAGKKICVLSYIVYVAGTATAIKFTNGSGGSTLAGTFHIVANDKVIEEAPTGTFLFETTSGTALYANFSNANGRSMRLTYVEV